MKARPGILRQKHLFLFVYSVAIMASPSQLSASPVLRTDANQVWQSHLCKESFSGRPSAFWQEGVFDAQVEGRLLEPPSGKVITPKMVESKARSMAKIYRYGSFASGVCANGNAWMITSPAKSPLIPTKSGYQLPVQRLDQSCRNWTANFLPSASGRAVQKSVKNGKVAFSKSETGTMSVECLPHRPRWLGKQLWYLAPVGIGPQAKVPHDELLTGTQTDLSLLQWINTVRRDVNLKPLLLNTEITKAATILAINKLISHDRSLLKKVATNLQSHHIQLLGENRVAGDNINDAAWLLWNSPSHRSLLLTAEATSLGVSWQHQNSDLFIVMAVGKSTPLTTAKSNP